MNAREHAHVTRVSEITERILMEIADEDSAASLDALELAAQLTFRVAQTRRQRLQVLSSPKKSKESNDDGCL